MPGGVGWFLHKGSLVYVEGQLQTAMIETIDTPELRAIDLMFKDDATEAGFSRII
jgi:hypothetical protein